MGDPAPPRCEGVKAVGTRPRLVGPAAAPYPDRATGFGGRGTLRWSRRLISPGERPVSLETYPAVVEGADFFVEH